MSTRYNLSQLLEMKRWNGPAHDRVDANPELLAHVRVIFKDWPNMIEHLEWVATAPIPEIVAWAEQIKLDESAA